MAASLMLLLLLPLAVASQLTNHRQQDRTDHGLIHRADAALSLAKCDGRDRVAIHDSLGKPLLTQSDPAEQSVVDHPRYLRNAIALSRPANRGRPMPGRARPPSRSSRSSSRGTGDYRDDPSLNFAGAGSTNSAFPWQ